jgi:hypothetical protein
MFYTSSLRLAKPSRFWMGPRHSNAECKKRLEKEMCSALQRATAKGFLRQRAKGKRSNPIGVCDHDNPIRLSMRAGSAAKPYTRLFCVLTMCRVLLKLNARLVRISRCGAQFFGCKFAFGRDRAVHRHFTEVFGGRIRQDRVGATDAIGIVNDVVAHPRSGSGHEVAWHFASR